jgi:outer membrane cobalamin receptor
MREFIKMMVENILSRSVRLVCAGGMALGVSAAFAQDAQQPMQKVEVTGSRIPTANLEGTSPITVLGAKDIKVDGVRNVESLLNNLPQVFAAQTGAVANGATGTATVNLRGLGSNRTLVLVNGKRLPSGSAGTAAADLNQIPTALVKRVEVLTGGAGAVYGADATTPRRALAALPTSWLAVPRPTPTNSRFLATRTSTASPRTHPC